MGSDPRQLVLDLPHRSALGAQDFLVSGSNAAAVSLVDAWPDWPSRALIVVAPPGAGKSHLVSVWRERAGALSVAAGELGEPILSMLGDGQGLAVEDIDRGIADERILFHLINLTRERRLSLLLTSRSLPGTFAITLPDLRSRLRALPLVTISDPDEALLKAILVKLFADRQLAIEPHVIEHISRHMERSTQAANRIVAEVDRLALATHRRVTRALAAEAMERLRGPR